MLMLFDWLVVEFGLIGWLVGVIAVLFIVYYVCLLIVLFTFGCFGGVLLY